MHDVVLQGDLDSRIDELLGAIVLAGPQAQRESKALIRSVAHCPIDDRVIADTAARIARVRATPEAKEGVAAFLDKRRAAWVPHRE